MAYFSFGVYLQPKIHEEHSAIITMGEVQLRASAAKSFRNLHRFK